jgi:hypothetical protein
LAALQSSQLLEVLCDVVTDECFQVIAVIRVASEHLQTLGP